MYQLYFDERLLDGDAVRDFGGVEVVVDKMSKPYLDGASIDFADSIDRQGSIFSTRKGMTMTLCLTAAVTSLRTCFEVFDRPEKMRTITRANSIASIMLSPHSRPGKISRGAIQHRIPDCSSRAQTASAAGLSSCAYDMKIRLLMPFQDRMPTSPCRDQYG